MALFDRFAQNSTFVSVGFSLYLFLILEYRMKKLILFFLLVTNCMRYTAGAQEILRPIVKPQDELYGCCFDAEGLLWLCTDAGLKWFDGYALHDYAYGHISDKILRVVDDGKGDLWAGTVNGLLRIDKAKGLVRRYMLPKQSQRIVYALCVTGDGTLYVGTDDGFSIYDREKDTFLHFNADNTIAVLPDGRKEHFWGYSVKDFEELPDGSIVMGTWSNGLLRYYPSTGAFYAYGRLNDMNSAYTVCADKEGGLWIGTSGHGVQYIANPGDYRLETLQTRGGCAEEVVNDIAIDKRTWKIKACMRNGVYEWDEVGLQWKELQPHLAMAQRFFASADGSLWVQTYNEGVFQTGKQPLSFTTYETGKRVRSLFTSDGEHFTVGQDWHGQECIKCIVQRRNGDMYMAAYVDGMMICKQDGTRWKVPVGSVPYLKDAVEWIHESPRDSSLWIGQRMGVSVLTKDGNGKHIDLKTDSLDMTGYFVVCHITEDREGNIWIASANEGIVRLDRKDGRLLGSRHYSTPYGTVPTDNVTACFVDRKGRVWAITNSHGLLRYNRTADCFEEMNRMIRIGSNKVMAINEAKDGSLWLATDCALVRVVWENDSSATVTAFTLEDGVPSVSFLPNATLSYGDKLYFGTDYGFFGFNPTEFKAPELTEKAGLLITDLLFDGTSFSSLDSVRAAGISDILPMHTRNITVPESVKNVEIVFSLLTYVNQQHVCYAYYLDGMDEEWHWLDVGQHAVTLEHLPSGTYTFRLRATDGYGRSYEYASPLHIRVLPPWYLMWWAVLIYLALTAAAVYLTYHYMRMRREVKASRHFSTMMRSADAIYSSANATTMVTTDTTALNPDADFLARAHQIVMANLGDTAFNRDALARELGMSVSSLYTRLRAVCGMSIQTYIQNLRLNAAADILRKEPDIRISELAYRVGFNTPKYFSQCFKREFGMLPGEFVKTYSL